jgi:hypothetical protein
MSGFGRVLTVCALLAMVGACVPGSRTATPDTAPPPRALTNYDSSAEGVEVALLDGTPAPMAKLLQRSVAAALERYNVPASYTSEGGGRYRLSGAAAPNTDPALASAIVIEWRIFDRRLGHEASRFTLPVVGDRFAWDFGDPRVIVQVGEGTSRQFVTLIDGTKPVAVDHGPHVAAASPGPSPPVAAANAAPARVPSASSAPAIFLARVGGAPGDGDAALAQAARAALTVGGLVLAARREDARYVIAGSVNVAAATDGRQPVRIVWEVSAPDGRPLGRAVQENAVPEGALNGAWGPMAAVVAGAAVAGITDVIRRSEETAARNASRESSERKLKAPPANAALPPPGSANFARAGTTASPQAGPSGGRSP